jgi:Family of unknown function (DUF6221)
VVESEPHPSTDTEGPTATFVRARLGELEAAAREALDGSSAVRGRSVRWEIGETLACACCVRIVARVVPDGPPTMIVDVDDRMADHISLNDPSFILARVKADRELLAIAYDLERSGRIRMAERIRTALASPWTTNP